MTDESGYEIRNYGRRGLTFFMFVDFFTSITLRDGSSFAVTEPVEMIWFILIVELN